MESIFKAILGIIIMVMILYVGLGLIWANNEATAADQYLHTVAHEISTANLRQNVIEACQEQAEDNGYKLDVDYISENEDGTRNYVVLTLNYKYKVSVAALTGNHKKTITVY